MNDKLEVFFWKIKKENSYGTKETCNIKQT